MTHIHFSLGTYKPNILQNAVGASAAEIAAVTALSKQI